MCIKKKNLSSVNRRVVKECEWILSQYVTVKDLCITTLMLRWISRQRVGIINKTNTTKFIRDTVKSKEMVREVKKSFRKGLRKNYRYKDYCQRIFIRSVKDSTRGVFIRSKKGDKLRFRWMCIKSTYSVVLEWGPWFRHIRG